MNKHNLIDISTTLATDPECGEWNSYVRHNSSGSFFHLYEWKTVFEHSFGHRTYYVIARSGKCIVGVFPIVMLQSRIFGRLLCSLPYAVNHCGPLADDESVRSRLIAYGAQLVQETDADFLEIRSLKPLPGNLPTSLRKVAMTLSLRPNPDEIWQAFASKHRNNIRRVYKAGVSVQIGHKEMLDTFYELLSLSWRSLGTPLYGKNFFASILDTFGPSIKIFIAYQNGRPVAAALNAYHDGVVEGMWAAYRPELRHLQLNYVLYWEMIKDACENGSHTYHLGRSSVDSGGEMFKKKWLANTQQLYWHYLLPPDGEMPALSSDNPKYKLAIDIWRRMPLWLTKVLGVRIAPNLP